MLQLAIRAGALDHRPVCPERLEARGPRQGFFEHADSEAVRRHLPPAYQDVLDFAYYSGWRKREILELRWREVDEGGGVVACRRNGPTRGLGGCCRLCRPLPRCWPADGPSDRERIP